MAMTVSETLMAGAAVVTALRDLLDKYADHDQVDMTHVLNMMQAWARLVRAGPEFTGDFADEIVTRLQAAITRHEVLEPGSPLEPEPEL